MKKNIALIGYMGTGKTIVGQILAEKLGMNLIEVDWLIEQTAGISIPEIFEKEGESGFREREMAAIEEIAGETDSVIACGGGLVVNRINVDRLKEHAVIVYLTASPETIFERVSGEAGQRPLLDVEDPMKTIREMLEYRKLLYESAADITISTDQATPDEVAGAVIGKLEQYEYFNSTK